MKSFTQAISLFVVLLFVWLLLPKTILARDQFFGGKVFLTVDQREVETSALDGVIVYREDKWAWSSHQGVISVSLSQPGTYGELGSLPEGGYGFLYNRSIGEGLATDCGSEGHCCGNKSCPVVSLGGKVSEAQCGPHYHCSLSCGSDNTPHRLLAYFPPDYNFSKLPPGIGYQSGDMKGGGSWQIHPNGASRVSIGGTDLTFEALHFGQITYGPEEWAKTETMSNQSGRKNIDVEWLPPGDFSCTSLSSDATGEIQVGQKLIFTCSGSLNNLNLAGYDYRLKRPSDNDWFYPEGWSGLSGSTPEFEVTQAGDYQVQCRVCVDFQGNTVCTAWGQAN